MKSLKEVILESKKDYSYTIKIAASDLPKERINAIENELNKYEIKKFSKFKKTIVQENPLDFPNHKHVSIFIADVTVAYPFTIDTIERVVSEASGLSRADVIVYAENDPRKAYAEEYLERNSPEFKEKYVPRLGSEDKPVKQEPLHGAEFLQKLAKEQEAARKERKEHVVTDDKISYKMKKDKSTHGGEEKGKINTQSVIGGQTKRYT